MHCITIYCIIGIFDGEYNFEIWWIDKVLPNLIPLIFCHVSLLGRHGFLIFSSCKNNMVLFFKCFVRQRLATMVLSLSD